MFNLERWREIAESIRSNLLRTVLSGFTIAMGLFIFIFLLGIGRGLRNSFALNFLGDAANMISIFGTRTAAPYQGMQSGREIILKNEDFQEIMKQYGDQIAHVAPDFQTTLSVKSERESGTYQVIGSLPDQQVLRERTVETGRYINNRDQEIGQRVAVMGRLAQRDLIKDGFPVGKTLTIGGENFTVIGTFSDAGGDFREREITVPLKTLQRMKKNSDTLTTIEFTYKKSLSTKEAIALGDRIKTDLKRKHRVAPTDDTGIILRNAAEDMADTVVFMRILAAIVGFIGLGTLIAGMLGISNIMVYIVKERNKEFGIRKAVGAKPKDIIGLILQESILITVISGLVGIGLGWMGLYGVGDHWEKYFITRPNIGMGTVFLAFLALVFAGALAGFIPAYRAAKVKPVAALAEE